MNIPPKTYHLVWLLLLPFLSIGQHSFKSYSSTEGLSQSQVTSLCSDSRGNLWMGTYGGGACMYDGQTFAHFSQKHGLASNVITSIIEASNGHLWFSTDGGGVSRYDGHSFMTINMQDGLANNHIHTVLEDSQHNIWIGTNGGGVNIISAERLHLPSHEWTISTINASQGLLNNQVITLLEDHSGKIWIGTAGGLNVFNPAAPSKPLTSFTTDNGLSSNEVYALMETNDRQIWAGTFGEGVSILDTKDQTWHYLIDEECIRDKQITSLFQDHDQNVWIGSYSAGVCKVSALDNLYDHNIETEPHFTHYDESSGLGNNHVSSILQDRQNNLWIGTEGAGINKYLGDVFTHFTTEDGLSNSIVSSIAIDAHDHLWFTTYENGANKQTETGFYHLDESNGLTEPVIICSMRGSDGKLWLGTNSGVNIVENDESTPFIDVPQLKNTPVLTIYEDHHKNIWFGTDGQGAIKYNTESHETTQYTLGSGLSNNIVWSIYENIEGHVFIGTWGGGVTFLPYDESGFSTPTTITTAQGLSNNLVLNIQGTPDGDVLFGTYGGGINILKRGSSDQLEWQYISTDEGLSDDGVVSMAFDSNGVLWVGTNAGVNRIDNLGGDYRITHYGELEGFSGIECNQNAICVDAENNVWFGTAKMLTRYNAGAETTNNLAPQTHLNGVRLFFEEVEWMQTDETTSFYNLPNELSLPYDQNHITFDFIGISLKVPEKVLYQYKLAGADNDQWSPAATTNFATYANLPPGDYEFLVKACNDAGVWNITPTSFHFSITPPFWRTWWFYLISAALAASFIFLGISLRLRSLKRAKRLLQEQVKLRTHQLRKEKIVVEKQKIIVEQTNQDLSSAYEKLKDLEGFKQSMMGMIVHDLKNPLNVVLGYSNSEPSEASNEIIYQSGKQMLNLVMNILDVQKFEDTSVQLKNTDHAIAETITSSTAQVNMLAQNKDIDLQMSCAANLGGHFDSDTIERVIVNLLTNAIKFTPKGGKIQVNSVSVGDMIKISVTDNGAGIPSSKLSTLFDRFTQVDSKNSGQIASTGIGLAFCKLVIEAHGGEVTVESELGVGTCFSFTIPVSQNQVQAAALPVAAVKSTKKSWELSLSDKKKLLPLLKKLKGLTVYHTSDNKKHLVAFEQTGSKLIKKWMEAMHQALANCDDLAYQTLKQKIQ